VPTAEPAGPADVPALAALAALTFPLACPPGSDPADTDAFVAEHLSEAAFRAHLADPAAFVLLARDDDGGPPIGYVLAFVGEPVGKEHIAALIRTRPTSELSKCYVIAERHGSGAARQLVAAALAEAGRRGAAGMWLGVNGRNRRAQRFYAKNGFAVIGERRFAVGAVTYDDLVMERAIAPPGGGGFAGAAPSGPQPWPAPAANAGPRPQSRRRRGTA
jgi:tRNA (guanine37-N1)-methyltransferase